MVRLLSSFQELIPENIRWWLRTTRAVTFVRRMCTRLRWWGVEHDRIFDEDYFAYVEKMTSLSASAMADSITHDLRPKSVLDVGCGTGALIQRLRELGVEVRGYERAKAALEYCRQKGLDVVDINLLSESPPESDRADVVVCMEVAHQLPASEADRIVEMLCSLGESIVFSSESPGGSDRHYLNIQPHDYWVRKFSQRGFVFCADQTVAWKNSWKQRNVAEWFIRNLMIFRPAQAEGS